MKICGQVFSSSTGQWHNGARSNLKWAGTIDINEIRSSLQQLTKMSWYLTPDENKNCLPKLRICWHFEAQHNSVVSTQSLASASTLDFKNQSRTEASYFGFAILLMHLPKSFSVLNLPYWKDKLWTREAYVTVYKERLWLLTIETGSEKPEQIFLSDFRLWI